jgi:hypothetical protein
MKSLITLLLALDGLLLVQSCSQSSQGQREAAKYAAFAARLDALEAESEIRHKLQTYMAVLRASDWDNCVNYFTRDGRLIMTEGTRVGRDDIKERMSTAAARMAAAAQGRPARKRADLLSDIEVHVDGAAASAKAASPLLGRTRSADSTSPVRECISTNGRWKKANGASLRARWTTTCSARHRRPQQHDSSKERTPC